MIAVERKIAVFENTVAIPALEEICSAPALLADFDPDLVAERPVADAHDEEILASLARAMRRREGPSLVLMRRDVSPGTPPLGGRFVMTVFYEVHGDEVFASPGVMYWMAFNNKLHGFAHRYDHAVARHRVEDVTRSHAIQHILESTIFYKLHAFGESPFPGYRY